MFIKEKDSNALSLFNVKNCINISNDLTIFSDEELYKLIFTTWDTKFAIYVIDNRFSNIEWFQLFNFINDKLSKLWESNINEIFIHYFQKYIIKTSALELKHKWFIILLKKFLNSSKIVGNVNPEIFKNINIVLKYHLKYDSEIESYNKLLESFLTNNQKNSNTSLEKVSNTWIINDIDFKKHKQKISLTSSIKSIREYINDSDDIPDEILVTIYNNIRTKLDNSNISKQLFQKFFNIDNNKVISMMKIWFYFDNFFKEAIKEMKSLSELTEELILLLKNKIWNFEEDEWFVYSRIKLWVEVEKYTKKYLDIKWDTLSIDDEILWEDWFKYSRYYYPIKADESSLNYMNKHFKMQFFDIVYKIINDEDIIDKILNKLYNNDHYFDINPSMLKFEDNYRYFIEDIHKIYFFKEILIKLLDRIVSDNYIDNIIKNFLVFETILTISHLDKDIDKDINILYEKMFLRVLDIINKDVNPYDKIKTIYQFFKKSLDYNFGLNRVNKLITLYKTTEKWKTLVKLWLDDKWLYNFIFNIYNSK